MSIDTDQATLDRWLAAGQWVEFAPGLSHPNHNRESGVELNVAPADWQPQECETCQSSNGHRDVGGVQVPCPDCKGTGKRRLPVTVPCECLWMDQCPNCNDMVRGRITVAWAIVGWVLPVISAADEPRPVQGTFDQSFITLRHHREMRGGRVVKTDPVLVRFTSGQRGEGERLTLPPDINPREVSTSRDAKEASASFDPASLVGQWARGGTIEVGS